MTFAQLYALVEGERTPMTPSPAQADEQGYASVLDALEMAGMRFG